MHNAALRPCDDCVARPDQSMPTSCGQAVCFPRLRSLECIMISRARLCSLLHSSPELRRPCMRGLILALSSFFLSCSLLSAPPVQSSPCASDSSISAPSGLATLTIRLGSPQSGRLDQKYQEAGPNRFHLHLHPSPSVPPFDLAVCILYLSSILPVCAGPHAASLSPRRISRYPVYTCDQYVGSSGRFLLPVVADSSTLSR